MTSTLQPYAPPTTTTVPLPPSRTPLVVPLAPGRGWALADTGRRSAALLALPLALLTCALATTDSHVSGLPVVLLWGWLLVGPATFYSLARVLRPEPRSAERTPRHLLAGAGAAFGAPTLLAMAVGYSDDDVIIGFGLLAAVLGVLTATWGMGAFVVRATQR